MISVWHGGRAVGSAVGVACTFLPRLAGLMFRKRLPEGSGLLLTPCAGIHMCFMRMPLDIVYLDGSFHVLGTERGLKPWRMGRAPAGTRQVLELPVGTVDRCAIAPGDTLKAAKAETAC